MKTPFATVGLILLIIMQTMVGCAVPTGQVELAYHPDSGNKGLLSTIKPITIVLRMQDQRHWTERTKLGVLKNLNQQVVLSVMSRRDVMSVIYEALKNELETNHQVVSSQNLSDADVTLFVKLQRYWSDYVPHLVGMQMRGILAADIEVVSRDNMMISQQSVQGTFTEKVNYAGDRAFESVLNGALAEFVRNLAQDTTILEAFRSTSKYH